MVISSYWRFFPKSINVWDFYGGVSLITLTATFEACLMRLKHFEVVRFMLFDGFWILKLRLR